MWCCEVARSSQTYLAQQILSMLWDSSVEHVRAVYVLKVSIIGFRFQTFKRAPSQPDGGFESYPVEQSIIIWQLLGYWNHKESCVDFDSNVSATEISHCSFLMLTNSLPGIFIYMAHHMAGTVSNALQILPNLIPIASTIKWVHCNSINLQPRLRILSTE